MRYQPHRDEIAAVPDMSDEERLEYFLYRVFETDEVWCLKDAGQPVIRDVAGRDTLPVWPYKIFAEAPPPAIGKGCSRCRNRWIISPTRP